MRPGLFFTLAAAVSAALCGGVLVAWGIGTDYDFLPYGRVAVVLAILPA